MDGDDFTRCSLSTTRLAVDPLFDALAERRVERDGLERAPERPVFEVDGSDARGGEGAAFVEFEEILHERDRVLLFGELLARVDCRGLHVGL